MAISACTAMRPLELTMQYTFALLTRKSASMLEMGNYFLLSLRGGRGMKVGQQMPHWFQTTFKLQWPKL